MHHTHGANVFTIDDLDNLFGRSGCIEGTAFLFLLLHVCIYSTLPYCVVLIHFMLLYVMIFIHTFLCTLFWSCEVL